MNTLDYSKAEFSRARTADYYPGQSASGPFYNPNLNNSQGFNPSLASTKFYRGDASQYQSGIYPSGQPTQSYQQYRNQVPNQNLGYGRQVYNHYNQTVPEQIYHSQHQVPHYQATQSTRHNQYPNAHYMGHQSQVQQPQYQPSYQPTIQRQFLSFRPMMPNQINQVAKPNPNFRMDQRQSQQSASQFDFKVFCPACHQEYYNSQVQEHIERHYLYNTEQFKLSNLMMDATQVSNDQIPQQLTVQPRFFYPLIEPQQFECKQLDEVNYINKYKLQMKQLNKKQSNVKVKSQSTQFAKPPLQIRSENTDIYNCFDNIFNSKNKFKVDDLTKSNAILAKKRQLQDWEKLRSHKEGYFIKPK